MALRLSIKLRQCALQLTAADPEFKVPCGAIHSWWKAEQIDWCAASWQSKHNIAWASLFRGHKTVACKHR